MVQAADDGAHTTSGTSGMANPPPTAGASPTVVSTRTRSPPDVSAPHPWNRSWPHDATERHRTHSLRIKFSCFCAHLSILLTYKLGVGGKRCVSAASAPHFHCRALRRSLPPLDCIGRESAGDERLVDAGGQDGAVAGRGHISRPGEPAWFHWMLLGIVV